LPSGRFRSDADASSSEIRQRQVVGVDGNKLTIAFNKAGEKRVVDSFVERV
jgi:hypothetical protein